MDTLRLLVTPILAAMILINIEKIRASEHWRLQHQLEKDLFSKLQILLQKHTYHVHKFESKLSQLTPVNNSDCKDCDLSNPLSGLVMVRRLNEDWMQLVNMIAGRAALYDLGLGNIKWPTEENVDLAAKGLARVQTAYNLHTDLLVKGELRNIIVAANFKAADCFHVAKQYYRIALFAQAVVWLKQTLSKIRTGDSSASHQEVLYYLANSLCFEGDLAGSQSVLLNLNEEYPDSRPPEPIVDDFLAMSFSDCKILDFEEDRNRKSLWGKNTRGMQILHQLCRGEGKRQGRVLRCRYVHYHQPHLRMQPFKLEELHLEPPVLLFHDVITDVEAEILKGEAADKMQLASTVGAYGRKSYSDYRTSHVAWLDHGMSQLGDKLTRRVEDITQLDMTYGEPNQVSRYGVAGEYLPHTDNFGKMVEFHYDRLATLMFYLSEVKEGGHTAFLDLGLSVPPVKNSAVLWFHYLPSGEEDIRSQHSGCPVLQGSKWVLNRWIVNGGNEFRFPCGLRKNASYMDYYLY